MTEKLRNFKEGDKEESPDSCKEQTVHGSSSSRNMPLLEAQLSESQQGSRKEVNKGAEKQEPGLRAAAATRFRVSTVISTDSTNSC